jgi:hypothetical protein
MAMDSINGLNPVMEALRRQLAERSAKLDKASKTAPGTRSNRSDRARSTSTPELRQRVTGRLRALDPDDPQWEQKAGKLFLESVLLAEFGDQLLEDPGFATLIDEVNYTLQSQPEIRSHFSMMIRQLATTV